MKIKGIETHLYAPELNKVHLANGATMPAGNITTIRDFRAMFKRRKSGRYAVIKYTNSGYPCLNSTYSGYCPNGYKSVLHLMAGLRDKHNMPNGNFDISLRYVGT